MGSPVVSGDIQPLSLAGSLCEQELLHLRLRDQMKEFLDWAIEENGDVSDAFLENLADKMTPIGSILIWSSSTLPSTKYLLCNGQAVSRTAYASLFARIGTSFGSGDGSTTFNLPDLRDRVPVGAGTTYTLAQQTGSATSTLSSANLPEHSHGVAVKRVDSVQIIGAAQVKLEVFQCYDVGTTSVTADDAIAAGNPDTASATTELAGEASPTAVSVVQPVLGVYFIIKAL